MKFLNRALIAGVIGLDARLHLPSAAIATKDTQHTHIVLE